MDRRQFLTASTAIGVIASLPLVAHSVRPNWQKRWFISAYSDNKNRHFVAAFNPQGQLINQVPLPARGHGVIAHHRPGSGLIVARRPGYFMIQIDFSIGQIEQVIKPQHGQHFYGHGLLSKDNSLLITTENHIATGQGLIVLRDSRSYQIIGQYSSGGIGPHEAVLMPDGETLVVANGGIRTHPDKPRQKLNLDTMQPNLSYINLASGNITGQYHLQDRKLSIRHLAVSNTGKVFGGLQYQGANNRIIPLAFSHQVQQPLKFLKATADVWQTMHNYTASVCVNDHTVAISCPKGNLITFWDAKTDRYINSIKLKDGAGLAPYNKQFVATSGRGQMIFSASNQTPIQFQSTKWDNHLGTIESMNGQT